MLILGLIMTLLGKKQQKIIQVDKILAVFISGFIIVSIVSAFLGVDFTKSLWGNYYRGDGLMTLIHLAGLFLLLTLLWQEKWKKYTAMSISFGAFITSIWAVVSGIRFFVFGDVSVAHWIDGNIGVSFGQPKFLAGYLLVSLPFTIFLFKSSKNVKLQLLYLISIIIQTIAITFTKSWGGMLGIGLLATLIVLLCANFQKWILLLFSVLFVVISFFVIYTKVYQSRGFVAEGRERIVRKILLGTFKRPLIGWGWANADYAFESVDWPIHIDHDVYVDKAHSMILEVFATTGIAGLIFYLLILVRLGYKLFISLRIKNKKYLWHETLFLVFILYIFHSQTNVISIGEEIIFWVILGISSGLTKEKHLL